MASDPTRTPSSVLLGAALAGLALAAIPGCGQDETAPSGDDDSKVISETEDKTMTFAKFLAECDRRGGFVQTHAVCAGNNACRGMSYNKYDFILTEHGCKQTNTCGGMSCVVLPTDQGRTGESIYEDKCSHCHGFAPDYSLFVPPGTDLVKAKADFLARPTPQLAAIVAFGVMGTNENGTSFANMAPQYANYSRAELERVVDYVKALSIEAEEYTVIGQGSDIDPSGG